MFDSSSFPAKRATVPVETYPSQRMARLRYIIGLDLIFGGGRVERIEMTVPERVPGEHMTAEISQQPSVLAGLVERQAEFAEGAEAIAKRPPRFALLAARGSSDHAALYAKYLIEVFLGLPAGLVSPSTATLYGA